MVILSLLILLIMAKASPNVPGYIYMVPTKVSFTFVADKTDDHT